MPAQKERSGCIFENRNCRGAAAEDCKFEIRFKPTGGLFVVKEEGGDNTAEESPPPPAKPASHNGVFENRAFFALRLFIASPVTIWDLFAEIWRPGAFKIVDAELRDILANREAISHSGSGWIKPVMGSTCRRPALSTGTDSLLLTGRFPSIVAGSLAAVMILAAGLFIAADLVPVTLAATILLVPVTGVPATWIPPTRVPATGVPVTGVPVTLASASPPTGLLVSAAIGALV